MQKISGSEVSTKMFKKGKKIVDLGKKEYKCNAYKKIVGSMGIEPMTSKFAQKFRRVPLAKAPIVVHYYV